MAQGTITNADAESTDPKSSFTRSELKVNPFYGAGQIQKILASSHDARLSQTENEDRRRQKIQAWVNALALASKDKLKD